MATITIKNLKKQKILDYEIILDNEACTYTPNPGLADQQRNCTAFKSFTLSDVPGTPGVYVGYIRMITNPSLAGIVLEKTSGVALALNEIINVATTLTFKFNSNDTVSNADAIAGVQAPIPSGVFGFEHSSDGITGWAGFLVSIG